MISVAHLLLKTSFFLLKLIISIACSVKDSPNFFIEPLPLYTLFLFSMVLNDDIVDIEKPDGICSPAFVMFQFLELFSPHQSFLLNIHSVKHFWFWVRLNSRILDSSESIRILQKNLFC